MRPAGEIRQALRDCFPTPDKGAVTWREALDALGQLKLVNPLAKGERRLVRMTVENMVQAGELQPVAPKRVPGSRRPMVSYARNWATSWGGGSSEAATLAQVLTAWR